MEIYGGTNGRSAILIRFIYAHSSRCRLSKSSDKSCFPLPGIGEGIPSHGKFMPCFYADKRRAENSSYVCWLLFPSAQDNTYAKMAYFGVAYPNPVQGQMCHFIGQLCFLPMKQREENRTSQSREGSELWSFPSGLGASYHYSVLPFT